MTKERELLQKVLEGLDGGPLYRLRLQQEIREYLNHFPDATKKVAAEEDNTIEVPIDICVHLKKGQVTPSDLVDAIKKAEEEVSND
jgi:hypothetical protein